MTFLDKIIAVGLVVAAVTAPASAQIQGRDLSGDSFANSVLPDESDALRPTMWQGVDADTAVATLRGAPDRLFSPAAANLLRVVVMSGAEAPGGDASNAVTLARISAMLNAGHVDGASGLLALSTAAPSDPNFARLDVITRFLADDAVGACRTANELQTQDDPGFWARVRSVCFALAGEGAAAELTLDVARRQGANNVDAAFSYWLAAATNAPTFGDQQPPRDALELVLALQSEKDIGPDTARSLSPPAATALARNPDVSGEVRLAAAEISALRYAITLDELGQAFSAALGSDVRSAQEIMQAGLSEDDVRAKALMIKAALTAQVPETKADALAAALQLAQTDGALPVIARYLGAVLRDAPPSAQTGSYAPLFAEAAALAGDPATARKWRDARTGPNNLGASAGGADPANSRLSQALLDAMIVAVDPASDAAAKSEVARSVLAAAQNPNERAIAQRATMVLHALGAENEGWLRIASAAGARTSPELTAQARGALIAMDAAADAGVLAEAAIHAAQLMDSSKAENTIAFARAIRVLWRFSLDEHAQAAAVEALAALRRQAIDLRTFDSDGDT